MSSNANPHNLGFETTADEACKLFADQIAGKNVLITGVSPNGLGAEAARSIAAAGAGLVICTGRSKANVDKVIDDVLKETPGANLRFLELDLGSLVSARKAGEEVKNYPEPLHIVINNAGIMACPYRKTVDGFESQFGTNHLGHFTFTNTLMPKLVATAQADPSYPVRIVNVSSRGHHRGDVRWDDPGFSDGAAYDKFEGYGASKSANMLYSVALAERLKDKGILSFSLHPGGIKTELSRDMTLDDFQFIGAKDKDGNDTGRFGTAATGFTQYKTLAQGTATHIVAAFSPAITHASGSYLNDCTVANEAAAPRALDKANAERLWKLSEELVGEKFDL